MCFLTWRAQWSAQPSNARHWASYCNSVPALAHLRHAPPAPRCGGASLTLPLARPAGSAPAAAAATPPPACRVVLCVLRSAGYLRALLQLEEELFGRQTLKVRVHGLALGWAGLGIRPMEWALVAEQGARCSGSAAPARLLAVLRGRHLRCTLFACASPATRRPQMKKTKPEPRCCPECGERVGLSAESVRVHIRLKHPASALAR